MARSNSSRKLFNAPFYVYLKINHDTHAPYQLEEDLEAVQKKALLKKQMVIK